MKRLGMIIGLTLLGQTVFAEGQGMKVTFTVGDAVMAATLDDSPAGRDFASMLPLELELSDYHGIEKVADLGRKLDATGMPGSYAPKAGDITQYAPWSNLALFLKPFENSRGLIRIGQFDGGFSALADAGMVRIDRAE